MHVLRNFRVFKALEMSADLWSVDPGGLPMTFLTLLKEIACYRSIALT